tara:strand:- start:1145 stop:3607 length:2463 start_codon:yes stop_codon:yes gene_type:complete
MNIISKHISTNLELFIKEPNEEFLEIFSELTNTRKESLKRLLIYIDKIIDYKPIPENSEVNFLHIHIDKNYDFLDRCLILEFLIIKHFKKSLKNDYSEITNEFINEKISVLKRELEKKQIPLGASLKNGGNRIYKNWKKDKDKKKDELNFNKTLLHSKNLAVNTLVNTLTKYFNEFVDLFKSKQYGIKIDDIIRQQSYIVLNKEKTLNQIDEINNVIDGLDNVILFDSESKSSFINFNFKELNQWNDEGANFKNLTIITFGNKSTNINNIKNKLNQIDFKFKNKKTDDVNSYIITNNEINHLTNQKIQGQITTKFYGDDGNTFWDSFLLEVQIHENLYELISIKMRNIYSLVINEKIKKIVLEGIFEKHGEFSLISETTQQEFPEELKSELKENLSNTLDYIINSSWKNELISQINEESILVVPNIFLTKNILNKELRRELGILKSNKIITWDKVSLKYTENLLILNYLDPGRFPYYFFPNIIEFSSENSIGFYLNIFFKNKYHWANYNNKYDYYKLLNHQIRLNNFEWNSIKNNINSLKPEVKEKTLWDIESSYIDSGNKEAIKIKLLSESKSHSYHPSDLFICKTTDSIKIIRAIEILDFNINNIEIQNLEDITIVLPIYEKLADINKQEDELIIIRNKFQIEEGEDAGRLWKVLLKRASENKGKKVLYNELQELLSNQNLKMVSFQHFENHWINPESSSLAPLVKKVFLSICDYLSLPRTYLILISRIKNKTKQASRNNTRKMNLLFKDLFDDGCFDDISKTRKILITKKEYYQKNHSLEELGIDENHLLENLVALVELINPEISLQKVDSIESINL